MPKQKQSQSKGEYKKMWRRKNREEKRFNKPLNKYLKVKHANVYDEYCAFFKSLDEKNPTARDLTKTSTFKKWKRKQQNNSDDESTIKLVTYHLNGPGAETVTAATVEEISRETDEHDDDDEGNNAEQQYDEGNNAEQQYDEGNNAEQQHDEGNNAEQHVDIIQQIINEIELDQDLYNILNDGEPQHEDLADEGIGLNIEDEIVDPFDFELELGLLNDYVL